MTNGVHLVSWSAHTGGTMARRPGDSHTPGITRHVTLTRDTRDTRDTEHREAGNVLKDPEK